MRGHETPKPKAFAVFDFELDDVTPASSLLHQTTSTTAALQKVTDAAKRALSRSGRYRVITPTNTSAQPIRDASTGKLVNEQATSFATRRRSVIASFKDNS